jgi:hypothetical protein
MNKRLIFSTILLALLILTLIPNTRKVLFEKHLFQAVDAKSTEYVDQSLTNAGTAFLLARGFNAVVSVFQESEVQLEPGGVGVSLALGQALDPVNDLVERFSWVMLASLTSLGIQKFLIEITPFISVQILLAMALCFLLAGLWLPRESRFNFRQIGIALLFLAVLVRFAVPAMAFLNHQVYVTFLEKSHDQSVDVLRQSTSALESYALEDMDEQAEPEGKAPVPEEEQSWLSQMQEKFSTAVDQGRKSLDVIAKFKAVKRLAQGMIETIVDLIVVFVLNAIVLPLAFLWGIIKLGQLIAHRGFNLFAVGRAKIDRSNP